MCTIERGSKGKGRMIKCWKCIKFEAVQRDSSAVQTKRKILWYHNTLYRMDDDRMFKQVFDLLNSYKFKIICLREKGLHMKNAGFDRM